MAAGTVLNWEPGPPTPGEPAADTFLRLACLTYADDDPARRAEAAAMLAADPGLATASVHTAAACGRVWPGLDAETANRPGGPYGWPPLLYLAYSRLDPPGDPVAAASALLGAGADPAAGRLWRGLPSPFTALTGVLGEGERGPVAQPRHPRWRELAALLLAHGADANDHQGLYNRMFDDDSSHLELLLAHGLGRGDGGVWRARLALAPPAELLADQLRWAVGHDLATRTRLLLTHRPDPATPTDPLLPELAAEAARLGHTRVAAVLAEFGAPEPELGPVDRLVGAILGGGAVGAPDPAVLERARRTRGWTIVWAAARGNHAAVARLLELGFAVNARGRGDVARPGTWETALHQAAHNGDDALVDLLLAHGADPTAVDERFAATPAGWAAHAGHHALATRLNSPH